MLSLGASKPWPDALEAFNGERVMSGKAIAEFFEPLRVWLEAENIKNNVHIGWTASDSKFTHSNKISTAKMVFFSSLCRMRLLNESYFFCFPSSLRNKVHFSCIFISIVCSIKSLLKIQTRYS